MSLPVDKALRKAQSHIKVEELAEAEELYKKILSKFPKNKKAIQAYQKLKAGITSKGPLNSETPQEQIDELTSLYDQGQFDEILSKAKSLSGLFPKDELLFSIMGAANAALFRYDAAVECYTESIKIKPNYTDAYYNMGKALQDQGDVDAALVIYDKAIKINPNYADAYNNIGTIFYKKDEFDQAISYISSALKINPNDADAYTNMGNALRDKGDLDAAIDSYEQAIKIKPDYAEAHNNMGVALKDQGDLDAAIDSYKQAIKFKPDYAEAHKNLSFTFLNSGRLKQGLDEYEWRWKKAENLSKMRHFSQPLWDGEKSLKGKRILLWSEQGVGDTINWSSFLPFIASQARHCILECQEKLVPLLAQSFPNVEVKREDRSLDSERDDFDFHLPMGSLFRHFITKVPLDFKVDAFLVPDPVRVNFWRERLNSLGNGPFVGISWKSSNMSPERLPNYAPISEWSPVLKLPNVTFINLQDKDFADDLTKIKNDVGITVHNFDDLDHYDNLDDVAALCAALDIVVSTKTTVPLIAAGVGTLTELATWRQSSWNNILINPVGPLVNMFEKNTSEPWSNVFRLIAEDVIKLTDS